MTQVHIALQGRGGIGKSFVCFLLAQYINAKGGQALCVDTDGVNGTLGSFRELNAVKLDIFDGKTVDQGKFDDLVELVLDSKTDVVVDNGASVFVPFRQYMIENRLAQTLADAGKELVIHTVLTGGHAMAETVNGLVHLVDDFPQKAPHGPTIVTWLNPHWGPVSRGGRDLENLEEYRAVEHRVEDMIRMPEYPPLFMKDLEDMLGMRLTFDEALTSGKFFLLNQQRLSMVRQELFTTLNASKVISPAGANRKARKGGMEPLNIQAMVKEIEKSYKVVIKEDDPMLMALAMNDMLLKKHNDAIKEIFGGFGSQLDGINSRLETAQTRLIEQSEKAVRNVLSAAISVGKDEMSKAVAEAWKNGTSMEESILKDVRRERWISLLAMFACMVFAALTCWMIVTK